MPAYIILFIIGLIFLVKGADYLVDGSASLAKRLGMPTLIIGLTIVAFGTSMPEFIVNVFSAINGDTNIALGNILGSNIANISLILGLVAIIKPIHLPRSTVWKEIPFSLLAASILFLASADRLISKLELSALTRGDGLICLLMFAVFIHYIFEAIKKKGTQLETKKIEIKKYKPSVIALMIIGGMILLYFGGQWTVNGAVKIARALGLSTFLVSATIIALGTSLPELVTAIVAIRKKSADLAIGNTIGSNIFNIFLILGITAAIKPIFVPQRLVFDMLFLIGITFLFFIFMFIGKKSILERWQGVIFIFLYIFYLYYIIKRG